MVLFIFKTLRKTSLIFIFLFGLFFNPFFSCKEIREIDLTNKNISILAPTNNTITTILSQSFWWEEVEGVDYYNIQIVNPSFSNIANLVLDSNITDNLFRFTLQPGEYQWRVKGINGSSQTPYVTFNLKVDTTSNLSAQTILLSTPLNNSYFKAEEVNFSWQILYSALNYKVEIASPNFSTLSNIIFDTLVSGNNLKYTFSQDGEFEWRVRGQNFSSTTPYSNPRKFEIDNTNPNIPTLISPTNNSFFMSNSVDFLWNRGAESGSPIEDSLYIFSDTLNTVSKVYTTTTVSVTDTFSSGIYYWRVRSTDLSGNKSAYSEKRKFTIQ